MPKVRLEFDLNDEGDSLDFHYAQNAGKYYQVITEIQQAMRKYRKYHDFKSKAASKFFEQLDNELYDIMANLPEEK